MTELVLGTAQFGRGYGITNPNDRIDDRAVGAILAGATRSGITAFDTAEGYGDALARVGRLMPSGTCARYTTKFVVNTTPTWDSLVGDPLKRLGSDTIYGLMFHRASDLRGAHFDATLNIIENALTSGDVEKVGVSVYDLEELELAAKLPHLGMVQVPGSVVDNRLLGSPLLAELHKAGVEVHVRSVFLQGLLLLTAGQLPPRFAPLAPVLSSLDQAAESLGVTRESVLLGHVASSTNIDALVVGVTTLDELNELIGAWNHRSPLATTTSVPQLGEEILDPRRW